MRSVSASTSAGFALACLCCTRVEDLILKHTPSPLLRDFVELFWFRSGGKEAASATAKEAILPDGCAHLVINLSEDVVRFFERVDSTKMTTLSGSIFSGPQSCPYAILPAAEAVIGVRFRPGGTLPFLQMPAAELHNLQLSAESIFGACAAELRDRVRAARTAPRKFVILEQFLLQHLCRPIGLHRAVSYALNAFELRPSQRVSDVLAEIGLSPRRFSQVFKEQVGVTPKLFHRVRRFQRMVAFFPESTGVDWAGTAIDAGYYDQAHLIHEFRAFSSITPAAFLATRIAQQSHLPLQS